MSKTAFKVVCSLPNGRRRGGRRWAGGETIVPADDMTEDMLADLQSDATFVVVETAAADAEDDDAAGTKEPAGGQTDTQTDAGTKTLTVSDAIRELTAVDFTKSGKPKTEALEILLGRSVSGGERDDVFGQMTDAGFEIPQPE